MKITVQRLRRLIKEEIETMVQPKEHDHEEFLHGYESGHPMDDEGYMVKSRMASMKKMAADVCGLLDSEDQVPAWVQDLVATAHADLQHVHDYLTGDVDLRSEEGDLDEAEGDQDGDGDSDFADVMIARMVASGMPKEKAVQKTRKHDK